MRFLANENFPLASVERLREAGHDVLAVVEWLSGATDTEVLAHAARERRILLTFDRDYGELIFRRRKPVPLGVIYLRLAPESPDSPAEILLAVEALAAVRGWSLEGHFVTVTPQTVRLRKLS